MEIQETMNKLMYAIALKDVELTIKTQKRFNPETRRFGSKYTVDWKDEEEPDTYKKNGEAKSKRHEEICYGSVQLIKLLAEIYNNALYYRGGG